MKKRVVAVVACVKTNKTAATPISVNLQKNFIRSFRSSSIFLQITKATTTKQTTDKPNINITFIVLVF